VRLVLFARAAGRAEDVFERLHAGKRGRAHVHHTGTHAGAHAATDYTCACAAYTGTDALAFLVLRGAQR
jgi:hypothetical protein